MSHPLIARANALAERLHARVRRHPVLGEIYELIDATVGDYARDHGPIYAGALAFYAILSLIPMAILFGGIRAASGLMQRDHDLPDATGLVLQGMIFILLLASEAVFARLAQNKGFKA